MIKLRPRPLSPEVLMEAKVVVSKATIEQKVAIGAKPISVDFPSHWLPEPRKLLWEHQNHKCCYCERERDEKRESDLEHFRPKAGLQEDPVHYGYWWLAYDWDNYLFSCKACNQEHKKNQFPLLDGGIRAMGPADNLLSENPILINPFDDNPEQFIGFDWEDSNGFFVKATATATDANERGKKTILIVGLNRKGLPEERAGFLLTLEAITTKMHAAKYLGKPILIDDAKKDIERESSSTKQFAGFRRAYFRKVGLGQYIATD